ncbi:MAG: C45 family autoproteolytic acyltransferase/hydrolase, partial [Proteobacteria bacterium]|nr:C45 family autoproteolytic acyltransferase/hydrolase [Pseudomonadota bacterium]
LAIPKMNSTVEFSGSWYEIGQQQAYYFPEQTLMVARLIRNLLGISGTEIKNFYETIKTLIPEDMNQQMQGVADGLSEYWHLSPDKAWEIVLTLEFGQDAFNYQQMAKETAGCTAFAFHSDSGTFLAHNEDQQTPLSIWGNAHFVPNDGSNSFLSLGVPSGAVSVGMGMNEKGLAMTVNVGRPNKNPTSGIPVMLMIREVIATCDTLAEAVNAFTGILDNDNGTFGFMGANLMIVDFKDGSMARLQICSHDMKVTYGQELKPGVTYLAHTNHFDEDFSPYTPEDDKTAASAVSSFARYKRLMEIIPKFEVYNLDTCWKILSDHGDGEPNNNTISRYGGNSSMTVYSNVFTADTTYYTVGVPSQYLELYEAPQQISNAKPVVASITGTVTALGKPLAKAKVTLKGANGSGISLTTRTAQDGSFSFNNLENGTYTMTAKLFPHMPGQAKATYTKGEPQVATIKLLF